MKTLIHPIARSLAVLVAILGIALPRVALAGPQLRARTVPAAEIDPKLKGKAPYIELTVINGPAKNSPDEFALYEETATPVTIKATSFKSYLEGKEPISIVVLLEGHELWMGNESYETNPDDQYIGVFSKLGPAIEALSKSGPPGSQGAIVTYHTTADVKHEMNDLTQLTGDKLGAQKDYAGKTTRNFVAGLEASLGLLTKTTTKRRALVVVSDGADTTGDAARSAIKDLKDKLLNAGVEIYVVYFAISPDQAPPQFELLQILDSSTATATSMDDIPKKVEAVATAIQTQRYYLTFPGYDEKLKTGFKWDGKQHELMLKVGDKDGETVQVVLAPIWSPDTGGGVPWWLFVLIPVLLIALVVVGIKVMGNKQVVQAPAPVVAAAAPPPAPAGPVKTIMFNANMGDDGPPIVGWIVPLNGANQFQTFKLQPGVTKVGTGGGAHIVINDGFMSTEHAQFIMSPQGITLQDGGSTNGVYVNERRIDKHDLVDNDVITMGKTNFKFKTTL